MEREYADTYEKVLHRLEYLKRKFPGQVVLHLLGRTADGRMIPELSLGDPDRPVHILIHAAVHGREYANSAVLLELAGDHLYRAQKETRKNALREVCFHIIPMVNPDGVSISQYGPGAIRDPSLRKGLYDCWKRDRGNFHPPIKEQLYFRRWKANARGVDINRNFSAGWKEYAGTLFPSFAGYKGPFPESERETRALLDSARRWKPCCCISLHSSGNLIYWDYRSEGRLYDTDKMLARYIGRVTGYKTCSSADEGAVRAGCSDYFMETLKIPSVTIETGIGECPLPPAEYPLLCQNLSRLLPSLSRLYRRQPKREETFHFRL